MNYYKLGDAANADKIQAAFKEKGIDVLNFGFADKTLVYCSIGGVCVQTLPYSVNLMNILFSHPDYQELKLVVKPNFKVGDWVVRKDGETFYGGNYAEQITLIEVDEKGKCIWLSSTSWVNDDAIRLWTIADAKDGDVLCYKDEISLYMHDIKNCTKQETTFGGFVYHCCYYDKRFITGSLYSLTEQDKMNIHPATKEQRDLLFAKMKEAGYEWDAIKKELKKIPKHYDISNFYAGLPVLVRDAEWEKWCYALYSHYNSAGNYPLVTAGNNPFTQCIPFNDDTKHLLGTTDPCDDRFINW